MNKRALHRDEKILAQQTEHCHPPSSKNSKSPSLLAVLRKFVLVSPCERINCSEKSVPDLKMEKSNCLLLLILSFGYLFHLVNAVFMEKLADRKICADEHCSYVISAAQALEDYIASDCRFINLKKGQMIYVYSKLQPVDGAGVFWSGSVYGERYVDQMGIIGYFPSNHVNETQIFMKKNVEMATTEMDFFCI
ncbi:otoraplin-like isoform X1 [Ictalurus furcatus]|uniref:otoraplin-like isoform X1 n=1 Tax=Ictalurus furcatus TaxID=66913 RepID=UPI002350928C|nr:otoraplin-like isoform X1 [Ictalurus furcatus]